MHTSRKISERLLGVMFILDIYIINIIMALNMQSIQSSCAGLAYLSKYELYHQRSLVAFKVYKKLEFSLFMA